MVLRDAKYEQNYESIKLCIENSNRVKFNEENTKLFLNNPNTFFLIVYEDDLSTEPLAFAYGYYLPLPEDSTPGVYIYALETISGNEKKGIGNFLINQLRVYFFYERPISSIMFICDNKNNGLIYAIKRAFGSELKSHSPFFILNDNVDDNGQWKGVPSTNKVELELNQNIDFDD